jgi:NAD(P)-dependent dehydrogenase (short-subunit alcohol dehydrogenase family)
MSEQPVKTAAPVVLITGASRGIGAAIASRLAQSSFIVHGTSRVGGSGPSGPLLTLDVCSETSVQGCLRQVLAASGRIDVLVNNAGFDLYGALEETLWSEFLEQLDTNFLGAVRMVRAVLPHMRAQRGGRIVNLSSIGGRVGLPMNSAYAASKFALEGFSESLRLELLPANIFVSLIEPPAVATDTLDQSIRVAFSARESVRTGAMVDQMRKAGQTSPVTPDDVALTVLAALRAQSPPLRYPVGSQARWLPRLRTLMPQSMFERTLRRSFP